MLCKIFASQTLKLFVSACDSQFAMFSIIAVQYILQHRETKTTRSWLARSCYENICAEDYGFKNYGRQH